MTRRRTLTLVVLLAGVAATAAAIATQTGASGDKLHLSNRGRPVTDIRGLVIRSARIQGGSVLATRGDRALYRLDRANASPCFGVGPAGEVGNVDSATCPRGAFPTAAHPLLDLSIYEGTRRDVRELSLFRAEGIAADGIAAVEFLRPNGDVALRVAVSANVFSTTAVPSGPIGGVAAVDEHGKRVWRSP